MDYRKCDIEHAITLSRASVEQGGYPVGAMVVKDDKVLARGASNGKNLHDPTSHAETVAIREACQKLSSRSLKDCALYSSMEPCMMCLASSFWTSIPLIVYAASRDHLTPQHSEGTHNIHEINATFRRPIQLIHAKEYEAAALQIIHGWEASLPH